MSKTLIWILVGIGLLFFFGGLAEGSPVAIVGLIFLAVGLYLGLGPQGILRKEQVLETWAALIEKAQDKVEEVFENTNSLIKESKAPALEMERKSISPGVIRGLVGVARDFLVVTNSENLRMRPYKILLNARDYGENLDVAWYLTFRPTLLQAVASFIPFVNVFPHALADLDVFDQQDLRAYSTVVHSSTLKSVSKIMLDLNQDPSKIDRRSRGFLGIS